MISMEGARFAPPVRKNCRRRVVNGGQYSLGDMDLKTECISSAADEDPWHDNQDHVNNEDMTPIRLPSFQLSTLNRASGLSPPKSLQHLLNWGALTAFCALKGSVTHSYYSAAKHSSFQTGSLHSLSFNSEQFSRKLTRYSLYSM